MCLSAMAKPLKRQIIEFTENDRKIFEKLTKGTTLERRAAMIFQILILRDDFKHLVKTLRKKFFDSLSKSEVVLVKSGVLPERFITRGAIVRDVAYATCYTLGDELSKEIDAYSESILAYLKTEDLFSDKIIRQIIIEYVLFGDIFMLGCDVGMIHVTEYDEGMENEIVFTFMAGVRKEEALEFVSTNWDAVKSFQTRISNRSSLRLKVQAYFPRDVKIYNCYARLLMMDPKKRGGRYPDILARKELKLLDIDVTEETIRSVVVRIQKLKDSINASV